MDYFLLKTKCGRSGTVASVARTTTLSSKEYKKAAPVRAKLRAAAAWAK